MAKYVVLRAFVAYTGRFRGPVYLTTITFGLSSVAIACVPWLIGRLTGSLISRDDGAGWWTAALIAVSIGHDLGWRGGELLFWRYLVKPGHHIDDVLFDAVLRHPYGYFVDKFTGKVSSYVTMLGREYRTLLDGFFFNYLSILTTMPLIVITMFTVNLPTGLIFAANLLAMLVLGRKLAIAAAGAENREADEQSTMDGQIVDAIANFTSVKAFAAERREVRRIFAERRRLVTVSRRAHLRSIYFWAAMSFFVRWVILPSSLILNVHLYLNDRMTVGELTTYLAAVVLFTNYIWEVVWFISQLNVTVARIDEAYRYLFGDTNIMLEDGAERPGDQQEVSFAETIEFRSVRFAYPDRPDVVVLDDVDLRIRKDEKVGIVGLSGGGKSTLLKLLLGYYSIDEGTLLLDGRPVRSDSLTGLTAYVPQDTAVFHRSVRDNIAYAKPDAPQAEIVRAAEQAQAMEFIDRLQEGFDTLVGERGVKLSGGQRQRIAIARAILKDAPLLLLDEATSALDSENEKLVQQALEQLREHRTTLVIAHRLSTVQNMDRIVVFHEGAIVEQGTHEALLAAGGTYSGLWRHQSGGFLGADGQGPSTRSV